MRLASPFLFIKFHRMSQFRIFYAFLLLLGTFTLEAKEVRLLSEPLTDEVNLFSPEQQNQIRTILTDIEEKTTDQVFVYIIESLEGENLETFSLAVAEKSKIGQFKKDNGILLLLSTKDKKVRIEVGYGLEGTLTDVLSNRIIRNVMIPIFKQGDLPGGIIMGVLSIQSVLYGNKDSIPALQTDHPNGIGISLAERFSLFRFSFAIGVFLIAALSHRLLNQNTFYKSKKWLPFLLGAVVLICLGFYLPEIIFYLCFGILIIGNLYLLFFLETAISYLYSAVSLMLWIPIIQFSFNLEHGGTLFLIIFLSALSLIFITIKVLNDEVLIQKLTSFSNRFGTTPMGLLCSLFSIASLLFGIYSLIQKETILYSVFYSGLLLFIVNGFAFQIYRIHYLAFLSIFLVWLGLISLFYFIEPLQNGNLVPVGSESMVLFLQIYICLVIGYVLARSIVASNWIWRLLKYALIAMLWTLSFHLPNFLSANFIIDPAIFLISYISMFVLHFLYDSILGSSDGSYSYSSSYSSSSSSYGSSSSSYRSSSSSSSSGGGGGSFGGGGSSGSW